MPAAWAVALVACLAGCAGPMTAMPAEAQFSAIQPGMTREEVLSRVGRPTWMFGVRQEDLTIWNYRFNPSDCIIFQVSMRPNGTVRDASQAWDPACDAPAGRRR